MINLEARRHRSSSLAIHPYFGKVDPSIARWAIESYTKKDDTIVDPFCGSGTVLHEAVFNGRSAVGIDSSPLATMVAAGKLLGCRSDEAAELRLITQPLFAELEKIDRRRQNIYGDGEIPPMPRISRVEDWFGRQALRELARIRALVSQVEVATSSEVALLLKLAFSRIITAASKQQGESSYRRIDKPDVPGRVVELFLSAVRQVIDDAQSFARGMYGLRAEPRKNRLKIKENAYRISHGQLSCEIVQTDSRVAVDRTQFNATLAVTSPPYLMAWDYGLYHKLRFYWLGFDLDLYEETEIGRHLRRKNDDVPRYQSDMTAAFAQLRNHVCTGGHAVFVNAPSVVYGELINTNSLLDECGRDSGWKLLSCKPSLSIPGPHHGMYSSLKSRGASAPGQSGKREHILVFRKR